MNITQVKRKKNSSWLWPRLTFWIVWIYVSSPSLFTSPYLGIAQMVKSLPVKWEACVRSLSLEDPLEKEMATHTSILAWKILWTEEPGGLKFMESQRIRHNWLLINNSIQHPASATITLINVINMSLLDSFPTSEFNKRLAMLLPNS